MINSRVVMGCSEEKTELPFPKLMRSKTNKSVILFKEPARGTVVVKGNKRNCHPVGYHGTSYVMEYFEDLPLDVAIQMCNGEE